MGIFEFQPVLSIECAALDGQRPRKVTAIQTPQRYAVRTSRGRVRWATALSLLSLVAVNSAYVHAVERENSRTVGTQLGP